MLFNTRIGTSKRILGSLYVSRDIEAGSINVDSITVDSITGDTQVDGQITCTDKVYITDDVATVSNNAAQLHISNIGKSTIFLEADTDDITETDNPFLIMVQDGSQISGLVGINSDNKVVIDSHNSLDENLTAILFRTGPATVNGPSQIPTYTTRNDRFEIAPGGVTSYVNMDLDGNDITNVDSIESTSINTNVINDNGAGTITVPSSIQIVGSGEAMTITTGNELVLGNRPTGTDLEFLTVNGSDQVRIHNLTMAQLVDADPTINSSTTTSTTVAPAYINKINWNFNIDDGTYLILAYAEVSNSVATNRTGIRLLVDNSTTLSEVVTPLLHTANDYVSYSYSQAYIFATGAHNIKLQFKDIDGSVAAIRQAYLTLAKIWQP